MAEQRWRGGYATKIWIEFVFWKGGERVSRDFSRFLPSRGGSEWVIYRPFRILDDRGNLRYEASVEDRAICLAKKSAKTKLDRRTVFIANNFCSRSLFYTFPSFFFRYRKIFPNDFSPMLYFISSSPLPRDGIFLFDEFWKIFSILFENIVFFFFCKKDYKRLIVRFCKLFFKVVLSIFFSRNDVICCNGCSGRLKKIFSRQQMVEKFQLKKLNFWSRLPPLFFNLIRARRVVILFTSVNLKSIPELCWLSFNSSNVWLSSYRLLRAVEWWNVSCDR